MPTVGAFEAKTLLATLLDRVAKGEPDRRSKVALIFALTKIPLDMEGRCNR